MYNYQNTQKHSKSTAKKMAGPNASRTNPYMAPGAYQQTPNWMSGTTRQVGYGDNVTQYYQGLSARPYHEAVRRQEAAALRQSPTSAAPTNIQRSPTSGATIGQQSPAMGYSGGQMAPQGSGLGVPSSAPRTGMEGYFGYIPPAQPKPEPSGGYGDRMSAMYSNPGAAYIEDINRIKRANRQDYIDAGGAELGAQPAYAPERLAGMPQGPATSVVPEYAGAVAPEQVDVYAPESGSPPAPNKRFDVAKPMDGWAPRPERKRQMTLEEAIAQAYGMADDTISGMLPERPLDQQMGSTRSRAGDAMYSAGQAVRDAAQPALGAMSYEELANAARAAGINVPQSMTPEQIAEMDAKTAQQLADVDALRADTARRGEAIAGEYAPRTDALKRQADNMASRTGRAEDYLSGNLGPRVPIDASGPYAFDDRGQLRDGRVSGTLDTRALQEERDKQKLAEMEADDTAWRERRDKLRNDNMVTTDPDAQKKLARDAQKFSADFQIYKRGGGKMDIRDYIKQRAYEHTLDPVLAQQLARNYGIEFDNADKADRAGRTSDIDTATNAAKTKAAEGRAAEDARREQARLQLRDEAMRRGTIDRAVAADRAKGYYNTRPMREAELRNKENMDLAMKMEQDRAAADLAGKERLIQAEVDAQAEVEKRKQDQLNRDAYYTWANSTKNDIATMYGEIPIDGDTSTAAGVEWDKRKKGYSGPLPPEMQPQSQQPSSQSGKDSPSTSQTPADTGYDQGIVARVERELPKIASNFDQNASQFDKSVAVASAAVARGAGPKETAEILKRFPGGLDLTDPAEASKVVRQIGDAINDYGVQAVDQMGYGYNDIPKDVWRKGRDQMRKKFKPMIDVLISTLGEEEVEKQLRKIGIRQWWLYEGSLHSPGSATGAVSSILRGLFGG